MHLRAAKISGRDQRLAFFEKHEKGAEEIIGEGLQGSAGDVVPKADLGGSEGYGN